MKLGWQWNFQKRYYFCIFYTFTSMEVLSQFQDFHGFPGLYLFLFPMGKLLSFQRYLRIRPPRSSAQHLAQTIRYFLWRNQEKRRALPGTDGEWNILGGGNSNIFYFHPEPWGDDPIWRSYFSKGLKPPSSIVFFEMFFPARWSCWLIYFFLLLVLLFVFAGTLNWTNAHVASDVKLMVLTFFRLSPKVV